MAAEAIPVDKTTDVMKLCINAVRQVRDAGNSAAVALAAVSAFKNGDGSNVAHFNMLVAECGIEAGDYATPNTAAKALYDELNSVAGNAVTAGAAAEQLGGFLGV